jgi:outer membrane lipoprotein SlyB
MKKNHAIAVAALLAVTVLGGCASPGYYSPAASQPYPQPYPQSYPQPYPPAAQTYPTTSPSYSNTFGVIDSIQMTQGAGANGNPMGVGAVLGGVVGGLLGNQVGGGTGRTAATVAGAIGGAMMGNQVEQRNNAQFRDTYQVGVRLDNGGYQTIMQDNVAELRVGSRVRIENDRVYRY